MLAINMRLQFLRLCVRWSLNSLGLWAASGLFSDIMFEAGTKSVIIAGLVLAIINAILKPIVILMSLPAILLSLGLFIIFINGLMVLMAAWLYSGLTVDSYTSAILAGIVVGLVNYGVTILLEGWGKKEK